MKKLYEKNELTFAIVWIVIYCVLQSLANPLNMAAGIEYSASAVFCILLVTIFYRSGSLIPCIIVHSAINTLGTFADDTGLTLKMHLLHIAVLIAVTVAYTLILTRTLPKHL